MIDLKETCKFALVQAAPVMFNKAACVQKAIRLIEECAGNGAEFIAFPELFIPGYPYGMSFGFTVGHRAEFGRKVWLLYSDNSVLVPGHETAQLAAAAREAKAWVSIGVSERDTTSATLYNTNLIFSPEGELVSHHRKLKPTGSERLVWGDANQGYFPITKTPWGPAGSLICWENYMPLARMALYQKGVTLYLAPNTNDNEEWQPTVRHIAVEGHCFVINCDMYFTRDMLPVELYSQHELAELPEIVCRGGSSIIDPYGHYEVEPVWDREAILYADLDLKKVVASRMEFDVNGHYHRPDVFKFEITEK